MVKHNKNSIIIVSLLVFTLLLTSTALAEIVVEENDLTFDINYENLDDNDDELSINRQIIIRNTGENTENLTFSLEGLNTDYDLTVTSSLEVSANGESIITVSGTIPVNVDEGVHTIGTLKIVGAIQGEIIQTLKTDVQPMLELRRFYVYINGQNTETINDDGEKVTDLEPGDEIELRFHLKNLFDEDYDEGDIDGDLVIELYDSDFGDDVDEEEQFKIYAGENTEDEEIILSFVVPSDVEEGEYTLEIFIDGNDENKADYEINWELTLEVERRRDDVRVESFTLAPETVSCVRFAQLTAKVTNYGSDYQKHAALTLFNEDLEIDVHYDFELDRGTDRDNSVTKEFPFEVSKDVAAGTYQILASSFYDYNVLEDRQIVELVVEDCSLDSEEEEEEEEETVEEETEEQEDDDEESTSDAVKSVERKPLAKEDYLIGLIIVAIVMIFILITLLTVALFRK